MIPFLSSTLLDLVKERAAVLKTLRKKRLIPSAMEDFLATPRPPSETALSHLHESHVLILVIGFKAGTLLSDGSGSTYTSAEYDEAIKTDKEVLVFVKVEALPGQDLASWRNDEEDPEKRAALDSFKQAATQRWTPAYFDSPEDLALEVILALDDWEDRGRPGARMTFASAHEFFAGKNPMGHFKLLDFGTTLLGRDEQMGSLDAFATDENQRVCVLSGRGGIGKSKILHDWAASHANETLFLKDAPQWHEDSEKEIPVACKTLIVDDAHRQDSLNRVLQLQQDTATRRNLKLILSTRPGSVTRITQLAIRWNDRTQVTELPEIRELTREGSRKLAEEVLGPDFESFATHLAEIGSNTPFVIVAGGRLIAFRKIDPSTLTTLDEFRSTIFSRLLDEMDLKGPRFKIDPPSDILHLIAALGPVDVEMHDFQQSAEALFARPIDEILATIDELAIVGIVTPRPKPVRILPDVLSDYLLEDRCLNRGDRSTRYADRIYEFFGAHSLKNLMRNLAELDWRRSRAVDVGLNLLDSIWADIHTRFRAGDEYIRQNILADLAGAAIYQPDHIISLVRFAIDHPIMIDANSEGSFYRTGQDYVLAALPPLLEATAHHPERVRESVTTLWEIAKRSPDRSTSSNGARDVLKRLSAWHRYGDPSLNFAMLVEAIRLIGRPDAFTGDFSPFDLISEILEREGEFNEWQDEMTMSFGGFGLNYVAVGPVRESAIDYLEFALDQEGSPALHAVLLLEKLLHNFMNRVARLSTEHELEWQRRERERCVRILAERFQRSAGPLLKAKLYDALRSATAINCPDYIRLAANATLSQVVLDDPVAVVDAICTESHDLPLLSTEFSEASWERPINEVMARGRSSLERISQVPGNQAQFTIDRAHACIELRVKTGGFHRFMLEFIDRPDFLAKMADQLQSHPCFEQMVSQLSSVLNAIHMSAPSAFRERALAALESGATQVIHAAANNLRVFDGATEKDIAVIQAYAGYPDPVAQCGAIFAITYMGKFVELRQSLKEAALSIRAGGNGTVAADLADSFGPYGVPLTSLTREEASALAGEFLHISDWEVDQGAIPRFLSRFVSLFPDETFDLLLARIELNDQARANHAPRFRSFGLVHHQISFGGLPPEKRLDLGRKCIARLVVLDSVEELAELFWDVAGYDDNALNLILENATGTNDRGLRNICVLIDKSIVRLAFTKPAFTKELIRNFVGESRQRIVDTLAYQAYRIGGGVSAGSPEQRIAQNQDQFSAGIAALPDDPEFHDLARAMRRFT